MQSTILNENGGRCKNVGETTDGLPAYLYIQPCVKSVSADVWKPNTMEPSNGIHHVVVSVTDAAGNVAYVLDREVEVSNPPGLTWKVNNRPSEEVYLKEFTAKASTAGVNKTFILKGKVSGVTAKLETTKLKVASGAEIVGGKPGTAKETLELEGVTVATPAKCEVKENKIVTKPLVGEIVESEEPAGIDLLLLTPKEAAQLPNLTLSTECSLKGTKTTIGGGTLAEIVPQQEEIETGKLVFSKTEKKLYKNSKGHSGTAEIELGGKGATFCPGESNDTDEQRTVRRLLASEPNGHQEGTGWRRLATSCLDQRAGPVSARIRAMRLLGAWVANRVVLSGGFIRCDRPRMWRVACRVWCRIGWSRWSWCRRRLLSGRRWQRGRRSGRMTLTRCC